jgi:hypothetical protein
MSKADEIMEELFDGLLSKQLNAIEVRSALEAYAREAVRLNTQQAEPVCTFTVVRDKDKPEIGFTFEPTDAGFSLPDGAHALYTAPQPPAQPEPTNIHERWNIERDGEDLLVCFNNHDKDEKCEYQRFVPAQSVKPAQPLTDEHEHSCSTHYHAMAKCDCRRAIEAANNIGAKP